MIWPLKAPASPRSLVTSSMPDRLTSSRSSQDRQVRQVLRGLGRLARHPPDRRRVRAQRLDALLRPPQPGGGDHLHRPRDLLDVLDRRDAVLERPSRPWATRRRWPPAPPLGSPSPDSSPRRPPRRRRRRRAARGGRRRRRPRRPACPPRRGRSRSRRRTRDELVELLLRLVGPVAAADLLEQVGGLGAQARDELLVEVRHAVDGDAVDVAVGGGVDDRDLLGDGDRLALALVERRTRRLPRASVRWVSSSRSEPNERERLEVAELRQLALHAARDLRIGPICALPPTRDTEMPTLMAGRTPE